MKHIVFLILSVFSFTTSFGQSKNHKPFTLDFAMGSVFAVGETYLDGRLLIAIEPKYRASDQLLLGLRLEVAPNINFGGSIDPYIVKAVSSYLLTADYFFKNDKKIKPFIGAGIGLFRYKISNNDYPVITTKERSPGIGTRVGVEKNQFRLALEYNTTFRNDEKKISYISIKIGAFFGYRGKTED